MGQDDLISPLRAVSVLDPAIDRVATPINEYAETRDPDLVRLLPGARARWAVLEPLSMTDFAIIDGYSTSPLKLRGAFAHAVRSIEAFDGHERMNPSRMIRDEDGRERAVWSNAEMALIHTRLGGAFWYELGALAYERATAGNFWGGSASFTLPPSSEEGLERIKRQLAARAKVIAGIQSSAQAAQP
jgi:hypothetical protein